MIKLRPIADPKLCHLTLAQLHELADNVVAEFDCNVKPVTFSATQPADTSMPWQPLDGCGGNPIGRLKFFQNGAWV